MAKEKSPLMLTKSNRDIPGRVSWINKNPLVPDCLPFFIPVCGHKLHISYLLSLQIFVYNLYMTFDKLYRFIFAPLVAGEN